MEDNSNLKYRIWLSKEKITHHSLVFKITLIKTGVHTSMSKNIFCIPIYMYKYLNNVRQQ